MKSNKVRDFSREVILVKVGRSFWDGKIASEKAANSAADAAHAKRSKVEARILAIERKALAPISGPMSQMIALLKSNSRPWRDGGWRMMFSSDYPKIRQQLEDKQRVVKDGVREVFTKKYDDLRAEAEKDLNGLIEGRFPSKERMIERYDVRIMIDTLGAIDSDCRLTGMSETEAEQLAKERNDQLIESFADGNRAMVNDILNDVTSLHETLSGDKKFHGTEETGYPIVDSIEKRLTHCERFNITDDQKVKETIARVRKFLSELDMATCKTDKLARKSAAKDAKGVMDDLLSF